MAARKSVKTFQRLPSGQLLSHTGIARPKQCAKHLNAKRNIQVYRRIDQFIEQQLLCVARDDMNSGNNVLHCIVLHSLRLRAPQFSLLLSNTRILDVDRSIDPPSPIRPIAFGSHLTGNRRRDFAVVTD